MTTFEAAEPVWQLADPMHAHPDLYTTEADVKAAAEAEAAKEWPEYVTEWADGGVLLGWHSRTGNCIELGAYWPLPVKRAVSVKAGAR